MFTYPTYTIEPMPEKLEEGKDFYFNKDGLMVFTEAYHLKRGYCCKKWLPALPLWVSEETSTVDGRWPTEASI